MKTSFVLVALLTWILFSGGALAAQEVRMSKGMTMTSMLTPTIPEGELLYKIRGDRPEYGVLNIKRDREGNIFIFVENHGYGLGWGNERYAIVDNHGRAFYFTSRKTETPYQVVPTGLRNHISIYKNNGNSDVWIPLYVGIKRLYTILGEKISATVSGDGTPLQSAPFVSKLEVKMNVQGAIFIKNQNPGFGLGWGVEQYMIKDSRGNMYTFTQRTALPAITQTNLKGPITIYKGVRVPIFVSMPGILQQ